MWISLEALDDFPNSFQEKIVLLEKFPTPCIELQFVKCHLLKIITTLLQEDALTGKTTQMPDCMS